MRSHSGDHYNNNIGEIGHSVKAERERSKNCAGDWRTSNPIDWPGDLPERYEIEREDFRQDKISGQMRKFAVPEYGIGRWKGRGEIASYNINFATGCSWWMILSAVVMKAKPKARFKSEARCISSLILPVASARKWTL